jgi:Phospholipase B
MRLSLTACILAFFASTAAFAQPSDPRLKNSYTFQKDGWTYIHLEGTSSEIGFQHGYLLATLIADNLQTIELENTHEAGKPWTYFRAIAHNQIMPRIEPEYLAELQGIADGVQAAGQNIDILDIVALNAHLEISDYYIPWLLKQQGKVSPAALVAPGRCSAFIATGSATKDGKIVIAHSNWSPYMEGERWTTVFDIVPTKGNRILMDGSPGLIHSGDDFGVNSAGIMITETTLPMFQGWNPSGIPEFIRARKAMQYANNIDQFVALMREGNNGGYANSWLVGDRKTNEIAYLELGLKHTPLSRKTTGYFVSANFPVNPDLIRDDTPGFDTHDMKSTMNARHVRAEEFIQQHLGQLDTALAEQYLADHYDSYEHKVVAARRSLCGHEDASKDPEPAWDSPPYSPSGAVTGKVMDASMAEHMSFTARAGHPCGEDFIAAPFLAAHPEFNWQAPVLHDMKAGPWSTFSTSQKPATAATPFADHTKSAAE